MVGAIVHAPLAAFAMEEVGMAGLVEVDSVEAVVVEVVMGTEVDLVVVVVVVVDLVVVVATRTEGKESGR